MDKSNSFHRELESLINKYSIENSSNTPDFLLADYVMGCLELYAKITKARDEWHGNTQRELGIEEVGHDPTYGY